MIIRTIKYTEVDGKQISIQTGIVAGYNEPVIFYDNIGKYSKRKSSLIQSLDDTKKSLNSKSDANHTHDNRYYTETEIDNKFLKFGDAVSMFSQQKLTASSDGFIFIFVNPKTKDACSVMVSGGSFGIIRVSISNGVSESTVGMVRKGDTLSISYTSGAFEGNSQCLYVPIH